jgi:hypothetical protein
MSVPSIQNGFNAGEWSPHLFGRTDLAKYRTACSTLRNFYCNYRGGADSRAGTRFVGICRQGYGGGAFALLPPRNVPFQFSVDQGIVLEFGEQYVRFISNAGYITETPKAITAINNGAPGVVTVPGHGWSNGDEVFILGGDMPYLDGVSFVINNVAANTFNIQNMVDGSLVSTVGMPTYAGGATAARVYVVPTPYTAAELPLLKYTQSADVMTFTHNNHPPYNLTRISDTNWTFQPINFSGSIAAPAFCTMFESNSGLTTLSFYYQFVATAVDRVTGEESVASPVGTILTVDQATEAGTIFLQCGAVAGAGSYNFYAAPPSFQNPPTAGQIFGFAGTSFGPTFTYGNILPDFTTSPPLHTNPFATSSVLSVVMTNNGSSYSSTQTTVVAHSPIGKDPVLLPVVSGAPKFGPVVWVVVQSGGEGLTGGEAVSFIDASGSGSGAAATLSIGPATGTYPGAVAYFQQRRFYANTLNNPDTYFASQPGAFDNMDSSLPVQPDDAIVGSPWSQQVNGIQWMLNMPGGLIVFTGLGAWQLSGGGGGLATASPITPASQVANPQAYNGVHSHIPPIVINYNILYVQEKGSIVRDLSYNIYANIYTGTDLTLFSSHLFTGHQIQEWAWAEEPNKLVWAVREDGTLLCLTYLKEQEVGAWTRHDTNGQFKSVCTVSEPPVNAPYFIVRRLIQNNGNPAWCYFQERMDNRLWSSLESAWCVDCGVTLPGTAPNATIQMTSAAGVPVLTNLEVIYGGANYGPATYARIDDPTGTDAIIVLTINMEGVITDAALAGTLTGYTDPVITVIDPSGMGGNAALHVDVVSQSTVLAMTPIFQNLPGSGAAGDVIRMFGRVMNVLQFVTSQELLVAVIRDDSPTMPDDPLNTAPPATAGSWFISTPVSTVHGLNHLEGMLVSILADGEVVAPQVVVNGAVTLPQPASLVTVGLGFRAQLQTLYLDIPSPITVQGRRKMIENVVVRMAASAMPFEVGANQPDASIQPSGTEKPWTNMTSVETPSCLDVDAARPLQPWELYTGDVFADVFDTLGGDRGQIAIQQTQPIPLNLLAVVPWADVGDTPDA